MDGPTEDAEVRWTKMPPPDVVLVVRVAPVPQAPPAELAEFVVPRRDPDGTLTDWELAHVGSGVGSGVAGRLAATAGFWAWRRGWERRHPVGPVREVEVLRSIAADVHHGEPSSLADVLDVLCDAARTSTRLTREIVARSLDELGDVRAAIEVTGGTGTGIHDSMPNRRTDRALRAWSPPARTYVMAASPVTTVSIDPRAGLVVETAQADANRSSRLEDVVAVDLAAGPAVLTDRAGRREQLDPVAARPLGWVAPNTLRWNVCAIPLVEVWSALFEALPLVVDETAAGDEIGVTTRVPLG